MQHHHRNRLLGTLTTPVISSSAPSTSANDSGPDSASVRVWTPDWEASAAELSGLPPTLAPMRLSDSSLLLRLNLVSLFILINFKDRF